MSKNITTISWKWGKGQKNKAKRESASLNEKEHIKINMVGKPYYKWFQNVLKNR